VPTPGERVAVGVRVLLRGGFVTSGLATEGGTARRAVVLRVAPLTSGAVVVVRVRGVAARGVAARSLPRVPVVTRAAPGVDGVVGPARRAVTALAGRAVRACEGSRSPGRRALSVPVIRALLPSLRPRGSALRDTATRPVLRVVKSAAGTIVQALSRPLV
jgi:hypothetical protein